MVHDLYSRPSSEEDVFGRLEKRLGRVYARLRLGIEHDHEAQIFGQGINFFHPENWYSIHSVIRTPQADGPIATRAEECGTH